MRRQNSVDLSCLWSSRILAATPNQCELHTCSTRPHTLQHTWTVVIPNIILQHTRTVLHLRSTPPSNADHAAPLIPILGQHHLPTHSSRTHTPPSATSPSNTHPRATPPSNTGTPPRQHRPRTLLERTHTPPSGSITLQHTRTVLIPSLGQHRTTICHSQILNILTCFVQCGRQRDRFRALHSISTACSAV